MSEEPFLLSYQPRGEAPLAGWHVVRWWESRRLIFNGVLFAWGIVVLVLVGVIGEFAHLDILPPPAWVFVGVFCYGISANVCYTSGWILDLVWSALDANGAARGRQVLFKAGLVLSCLLTTIPLWLTLALVVAHHT